MSKRLQVVFDEAEYAAVQRAAERAGLTVSAWVRRTLRDARAASGDAPLHIPRALEEAEPLSLLELEGLGADLWAGEGEGEDAAADHVARERDAWN